MNFMTISLSLLVLSVQFLMVISKKYSKNDDHLPKHREIPVFRPLRRVIANYVPTRKASIKIIFQRSAMPRMRWFRQLNGNRKLPNAEIPNMINIEDDERYKFDVVSSHDITAVTLTIIPVEDVFPVKIVACFSLDRAQFQYQLDTYIDGLTAWKSEILDGILWTTIPERIITFNDLGQLSVACVARLESENERFTEELNIYRSYLEKNQVNGAIQVSSVGTGKIHKERDNFAEESGKYIYRGNRVVLSSRRKQTPVLYNVSFTVLNGSQDDVGVYTCAAERARDRTYVSSLVKVQQHQKPALILIACGEEAINQATPHPSESRRVVMHLIENQITCVRCRIFDYEAAWHLKNFDPRKAIGLKKDGHWFDRSTDWLKLDWHLNVADGGLMELTVTFRRPLANRDSGLYQCVATNSLGTDTVAFQVAVASSRQK